MQRLPISLDDNYALAVAIAAIPERIRGYGHVKDRHIAAARAEHQALMQAWQQPEVARQTAAE